MTPEEKAACEAMEEKARAAKAVLDARTAEMSSQARERLALKSRQPVPDHLKSEDEHAFLPADRERDGRPWSPELQGHKLRRSGVTLRDHARAEIAAGVKLESPELGVMVMKDEALPAEKRAAMARAVSMFAQTGLYRHAAQAAGVGRDTLVIWIRDNPSLAATWELARTIAATIYEDEARERAKSGSDDKSSGPLLERVLEADMPERYSKKLSVSGIVKTEKHITVSHLKLPAGWDPKMIADATVVNGSDAPKT